MEKIRFWEIDFFRGIAIMMMIIYHFIFDLNYFNFIKVDMYGGFLNIFQKIIAISFITLVGISLSLAYNIKSKKDLLIKGLIIFAFGLLITLVTFIFVRESTIYFGILHFIGLSIIISIIFLRFFKINLITGIILIILGNIINKFTLDSSWLLLFGIKYKGFNTLDYFPLFPWFGLILIGIFVGKFLYKDNSRNFKLFIKPKKLSFIQFLGRKSLIIYLIHQPILIGLLYLYKIL